jgi:cystathionine beta-lyase/cystathionine gamma-synthase
VAVGDDAGDRLRQRRVSAGAGSAEPGADPPRRGPGTRAVHAGERQVVPRRPVTVPVYQTAPYLFDDADELARAFASGDTTALYSRYSNPTVRVVEEKVAALEGAEDAVAFASGMAAISAVLGALLSSGDRLIAPTDVYGGTHSWIGWLGEHHPELRVDRVPLGALIDTLAAGVPDDARAVYLETPSNPLLTCVDLRRVAELTRPRGLTLVVDSTMASPAVQTPLALGADLVVHSATKFLAGHSDVTAGVVAGGRAALAEVRRTMMWGGACLDPHAAFLVSRGIKTLTLRLERQSANAARLAEMLGGHPAVERVHYPGLDPVGRAQMRSGGAMLAFDLAGGGAAARTLLDRLEVFQIYASLGGVESGVMLPAVTSHRQLTPAERAAVGIHDGTVRMSVGIEDPEDLEADPGRALDAIS